MAAKSARRRHENRMLLLRRALTHLREAFFECRIGSSFESAKHHVAFIFSIHLFLNRTCDTGKCSIYPEGFTLADDTAKPSTLGSENHKARLRIAHTLHAGGSADSASKRRPVLCQVTYSRARVIFCSSTQRSATQLYNETLPSQYHPEVAGMGVEYCWCMGKCQFRGGINDLAKNHHANVHRALSETVLPLSYVRKAARRSRDYMRAYRDPTSPEDFKAIEDMKKLYKSHRCIRMSHLPE